MDDELKPEPDCCDVWQHIMRSFKWMVFSGDDDNELATMPHLEGTDGNLWFVDFCPSCGKSARNRTVLLSRLVKK